MLIGGAGLLMQLFSVAAGGQIDPSTLMQVVFTGGPIMFIGAIVAFLTALIIPMALMFYVGEGSFGAAFSVGKVIKKCLSGAYIIALIMAIVWAIVLGIVAFILGYVFSLIPVIGFILALLPMGFIAYAFIVPVYTWFAQAYAETK